MLAELDRDLLTIYCQTWAKWMDAQTHLRRQTIVAAPSGYPILSPYVAIEHKARIHLVQMQSQLGLTPSARSRVRVVAGRKTKLERFLDAKARHRKRA
jgi:P27 family predicted phage terminase small subunit